MQDEIVAPTDTATAVAAQLRAGVVGEVIEPNDPGYDQARTIFQGGIDRRPAVIVKAVNAADVAHVVSVASGSELPLAVRSGGHSLYGVWDDAIVLDLSKMNALEIDADSRTAWAEPGVLAGEYTEAAAEHGLVTGFGDTASVGLGGLTVGGGIGYLVRAHGLTIDNLIGADVVTADGRHLTVDADNHPDLFWAIRGGGGNFGVVTKFRYRLHSVPTVLGGLLVLPATPEVVAEYLRISLEAPDELSSIINIMPAPPMPGVPDEAVGQLVILAIIVYAGDPEEGAKVLAPIRELGVLADMVQPMPFSGIYQPEDPNYHPLTFSRTNFVDEVDVATAGRILETLQTSSAMMPVAQLRPLGGAMARVPSDATAFAHRDRKIMFTAAVVFEKPEEAAEHRAWVDEFAKVVQRPGGGSYVNFLYDDAAERIHEAYPDATYARLVELKRTYDPNNLFKLNGNISPS
ncbi:FAD-binding oxidoreductase [Micromonospora sp. NPDC007208]|uniref:FAD-binding oxidoreductase n=1 Tax=Micromonospora sp. NPDC007208 TaxID=3364236 RepID=UPI0036944EEF